MILLSCVFAVGLITTHYLAFKLGKYVGKRVDNSNK